MPENRDVATNLAASSRQQHRTIDRLLPHHCRFIVADDPTLYCAARVLEGESWCFDCYHRVFIVRRRIVTRAAA